MKKLGKFLTVGSAYMYLLAGNVCAASEDAWSENVNIATGTGSETANTIMSKIAGFIKPIAAILIFASVLMIGFEIIMKRNKADDRMASMSSLMWVGIGTLVIAFAALIASFLFTVDGVN